MTPSIYAAFSRLIANEHALLCAVKVAKQVKRYLDSAQQGMLLNLRCQNWCPLFGVQFMVLYPTKEGIIVKTLFFHDEIAAVPKTVPRMKLDENEMSMAKMLIENMTKPFVVENYHDEYQERLRQAIMKKIEGQEIVSADAGSQANVIDLMDALQKSLEMSEKKDKRSQKRLTGTA